MRLTCTFALVCLIASCAPKKAVVIGDDPADMKPVATKNTTPQPAANPALAMPSPEKRNVMVINPDMTQRLPEQKDFQATAPPQTTADRGPNLIVPAPKPQPSE